MSERDVGEVADPLSPMFLRLSSKCSAKSFTGLDDAKQHKGLEGDHMRHIGATMLILLVGAPPALPDEVPTRKAGLWEIKTDWGNGGPSLVIRQCVDATTDYMMQSPAGAFDEAACSKRIVQRSSDTLMIDTACKIGGGRTSVTSHAVVTGSLDRAYTMTGEVESQNEALPDGKLTSSLTGTTKWLGPCAAGQKPGDWIVVP